MATYSKEVWNHTVGSGGVEINVNLFAQNSAAWWIWHSAPAGTSSMDQFWCWVFKGHSSYDLTQGWGTSSSSYSTYTGTVRFPSESPPWLHTAGALMQDGDTTGGYSGNNSYNWVSGYIDRIT